MNQPMKSGHPRDRLANSKLNARTARKRSSLSHGGSYRRQGGWSLIEVAISLVVFGVCLAVSAKAINLRANGAAKAQALSHLQRADQALQAYAQLRGRLPCAASDTSGIEDCSNASASLLPYITLGLAEAKFGGYRYERDETGESLSGTDRYEVPALTSGVDSADMQPSMMLLSAVTKGGNDPAYNLCWTLTSTPAAALSMAYRITAPGSANGAAANQELRPAYMSRGRLAAKMRCADLAVSGRAHFDVLIGAKLMQRGGADNLKVFKKGLPTVYIDISQGIYFAAAAMHGTYQANRTGVQTLAQFYASDGTDFSMWLKGATARAKAPLIAIHAATLTTQVVRFSINLAKNLEYRQRLTKLQADIDASVAAIQSNAYRGVQPIFVKEAIDSSSHDSAS